MHFAGVDPTSDPVSTETGQEFRTQMLPKRALTLMHSADQLRRASGKQVRIMIATVTASIATLRLPNRPDRIEPRAKKRRPKNLPLLTVPRQVARDLIYALRELNRVP